MKKISFKWWQVLIGLIVLVMLGDLGYSMLKPKAEKTATTYTTVKVKSAEPLTYSGTVQAVRTQVLVPNTGKAQSVTVQNGDHVEQGQAVMTTYSQDYEEQVADARSALSKAQRQVTQQQQALTQAQNQLQKLTSTDEGYSEAQEQVTTAKNQLEDAKADVTDAQNKLNTLNSKVNGSVTAPFAGTVTVEYDKTGQPSVTLVSDELQASTTVSEYDYNKVSLEQQIKVTSLATKKKQETQINYRATTPAENSKANEAKYTVTAPLTAGDFMVGQTLNISIPQEGLQVPATSVKNGYVYIVVNKKAQKVAVTGQTSNGSYIVTDGLSSGQRVIVDPDGKLKDGKRVETND